MPSHRHQHWFEHHHGLLRLVCYYFVDVDGPEIHSRNAMPWSRLFLVGAHSAASGSRVTDLTARHRKRVFALTPGAVLFMPPGRLLAFDFSPELRMLAFHFRLEVAPGQDLLAGADGCALRQDRGHFIAAAYAALRARHHLGTVTLMRGLLLALASDFLVSDLGVLTHHRANRSRFAPVLEHIDAHCRADLRIADLAALMEMGREHFTRQFRLHLGISPKSYVGEQVLERACARLLSGERVGEVAAALGFASPFYFSRFFKARTGVSPRRFAIQHLAGA